MKRASSIITSILLLHLVIVAQETPNSSQVIGEIAEELITQNPENADLSEILDALTLMQQQPVKINVASSQELEQLIMLSEFQILSLIKHRKTFGPLVSYYDLQLVDGFDYNTINLCLPFISFDIEINKAYKRKLSHGNHQLLMRAQSLIETPVGYNRSDTTLTNLFPGNRLRLYTRYAYQNTGFLKWGFTTEKDPGEDLLINQSKWAFDFFSAHFQLNTKGLIKQVNVGDYKVKLGQGLILWNGLGYSKSIQVLNIRKRNSGLSTYSSSNENNFFRGAATQFRYKKVSLKTFASFKNIDANLSNVDNTIYYTSLPTSGIHATSSEIENKKAMHLLAAGGSASLNLLNINLSLNAIHYKLEYPKLPSNSPANYFDFNDTQNTNLSVDFHWRVSNLLIFGELATDKKGNPALLAGSLFKFNSRFNVSLLYRNYAKKYNALFSNGFREGSQTRNEEGFYLGAVFYPYKKWKISAYYDFYSFPWLSYNTSSPTKGYDYKLQLDYILNKQFNAYIRYSQKNKEENRSSDNSLYSMPLIGNTKKEYIRLHFNSSFLNRWQFRNRVELSFYNTPFINAENGFLIYQDIIYSFQKTPLKFNFRYALFDTPSYQSRIYMYEADVLNAYSVPAVFYRGSRYYLLINYQLSTKISLWLKYSHTRLTNQNSIGSGLNLINEPHKSEVKLQLRIKL